jgi:hypothetical protein
MAAAGIEIALPQRDVHLRLDGHTLELLTRRGGKPVTAAG